MNIGIIGCGAIAATMAETLNGMGDRAKCYAVASRSLDKAKDFCEKYGAEKAYGSYEDLVRDESVDIVYIATPHSHHERCIKLCLDYGKAVLCEKAFTRNAKEAEEVLALAKEKKVLLAEAIWTRYMPSRKIIDETIESGIIGNVISLSANLHYAISFKERIMKKELAGGALLDVGVYPLNFALMHFGTDIQRIDSSCAFTDTGVDYVNSMTVYYKDGRTAFLTSGVYGRSDRKGIFYGDKGYIIVENINNPQCLNVYDLNDNLLKHIDFPKQISGYEYEVEECMATLMENKLECPSMPHTETLRVMKIMDSLRSSWGLSYPDE